MSIGNLILGVNSVAVSYLIHYDCLLPNATDFIKTCESYFIKKCDRNLLQNTSDFLLQNTAVLLQNVSYYKLRRFYYKMRRLLQISTVQQYANNRTTLLKKLSNIFETFDLHSTDFRSYSISYHIIS